MGDVPEDEANAQEEPTLQEEPTPQDDPTPQELLRAAWDERGVVETTMEFEKVNQTTLVQMLRGLKEMDGKFSVKYKRRTDIAISDETYHMTGKSAYPITKKLLLLSGQNSVAQAIKRYLHLHYKCNVMQVSKNNFF